MSETKVRKSILTLAEVQEGFTAYGAVRAKLGMPVVGHTFDRGARGKGFAQYDEKDAVVRSFDSKEDAHTFYSRYVEVATEVLSAPLVTLTDPEKDADGPDDSKKAPKVPAARKSAEKDAEKVTTF